MKLVIAYGTRPELIKLAPVYINARERTSVIPILISVGQHDTIVKQVERYFELRPDIKLELMTERQTLASLSSKILDHVTSELMRIEPDYVVVQGDTTTALMVALAANYLYIPVGHVEAGLRSFDIKNPYPEEMNRVLISKIATHHYAPTVAAKNVLLQEGIAGDKIVNTGNTIIDAIKYVLRNSELYNEQPEQPSILVTLHRRENLGERLHQICMGIADIAKQKNQYKIIFPMHPNPDVRSTVRHELSGLENVSLIEPLDYQSLLESIARASLVISDSGGIQEEASYFNAPTLICRRTTERSELIDMGLGKLVGDDRNIIVSSALEWLESPPTPLSSENPFGDGNAAERIVADILQRLCP